MRYLRIVVLTVLGFSLFLLGMVWLIMGISSSKPWLIVAGAVALLTVTGPVVQIMVRSRREQRLQASSSGSAVGAPTRSMSFRRQAAAFILVVGVVVGVKLIVPKLADGQREDATQRSVDRAIDAAMRTRTSEAARAAADAIAPGMALKAYLSAAEGTTRPTTVPSTK